MDRTLHDQSPYSHNLIILEACAAALSGRHAETLDVLSAAIGVPRSVVLVTIVDLFMEQHPNPLDAAHALVAGGAL